MAASKIKEQMTYLDRQGRKMPVFIAEPAGTDRCPAVIIIHEIFGLNDHIKDLAKRFAEKGFYAYAPDLFEGHPGLPDNRNDLPGMRDVWSKIPDEQLISDCQSVFESAKKSPRVEPSKVGTIGFCMGGAIALMFGCSTPEIAWIADFYGRIRYPELTGTKTRDPIDYIDNLNCPFVGMFAGEDELIPEDAVRELQARVRETGQPSHLAIYANAKHAFFNDTRELYNKEAAEDAWSTLLQFVQNTTHSAVAG